MNHAAKLREMAAKWGDSPVTQANREAADYIDRLEMSLLWIAGACEQIAGLPTCGECEFISGLAKHARAATRKANQ